MADGQQEDVHLLSLFLRQSRTALAEIVEEPEAFLVLEVYRESGAAEWLRFAWSEVQEAFLSAEAHLNQLDASELESLSRRGLRGPHLRLKLGVFNSLLNLYRRRDSWLWIHRFLGQMDTILDSLSEILPPLKVATEFKETIENMTKRGGRLPR